MFAAPPDCRADVYASLSPDLRLFGVASAWLADRPYHGADVCAFLEGPAIDRAGNLCCVDIAHGRLLRLGPDRRFEVLCRYDGAPNGLAIHRDGRFFIADHLRGLMVFNPTTSAPPGVLLRGAFGEPFLGLNDLVFSKDGDLYFTDQGQSGLQCANGRLFRYGRDGRLTLLLDGIPSPNGLVLTPDESSLLLAVTRANAIWRVPLAGHPRPTKVGLFVQMSGGGGPDGLAMDEAGTLYVAHPVLGSVWAFDRHGEPLLRIRSATDGHLTTNLCFGGPARRTLFITESTNSDIQTAEVLRPGAPVFSHA